MAYSNSKIITNVGYLKEHTVATRAVAYLAVIAKDGVNKYFIVVQRDSITYNGVTLPKGWVFLDKSYANGTSTSGVLTLAGGVKELISQDLVNQDITGDASQVKADYLTNGAALLNATNTIPAGDGTFPTTPALFSRRGEGITEEQVNDLLSLNNDLLPNETSTITSALTNSTTGVRSAPPLTSDPVGGIKAYFKDPIGYTRTNVGSGVAITVGLWDLTANITGAFRPLVIGKNSFLMSAMGGKGKRKRA